MVKILFFATLKDIVGAGSLNFQLLPSRGTTPQQVWTSLINTYPDLGRYRELVQVAVNRKFADRNMLISDGDEIAFFPPVSGGSK